MQVKENQLLLPERQDRKMGFFKRKEPDVVGIMPIGEQDLSKLIEALTLIRDTYGKQKLLVCISKNNEEAAVPLGSITFDSKNKTITFG
jgi:hypothetical protein